MAKKVVITARPRITILPGKPYLPSPVPLLPSLSFLLCWWDSTSSSFMSWQRHQETLWVAVLSRLYRDRIRSISGPGDTELITLVSNPRKFRFHVKLCPRPTSYMHTCAYSHGLWLVSIVTLLDRVGCFSCAAFFAFWRLSEHEIYCFVLKLKKNKYLIVIFEWNWCVFLLIIL